MRHIFIQRSKLSTAFKSLFVLAASLLAAANIQMVTRLSISLPFARAQYGEEGQDVVEYALICGLLSITALAVMLLVGPFLRTEFTIILNGINGHS